MTLWIRPDLAPLFGALDLEGFLGLETRVVRAHPDGSRCTGWLERSGRRFYLKVHRGVGWREIAKCWLQGKHPVVDARAEATVLERLARLDIPAPRLAAFGVRGIDPARRRSFVLTEALERSHDLALVAARGEVRTPGLRHALTRALGDLVGRLHAAGIAHQDLYLTHFRLRFDGPAGFELFLIDLHRARETGGGRMSRWHRKDLAALRFSTLGLAITRADCARFWRAYRAHRPPVRDEHGLRRALERRAHAIARRVARRGADGRGPAPP